MRDFVSYYLPLPYKFVDKFNGDTLCCLKKSFLLPVFKFVKSPVKTKQKKEVLPEYFGAAPTDGLVDGRTEVASAQCHSSYSYGVPLLSNSSVLRHLSRLL